MIKIFSFIFASLVVLILVTSAVGFNNNLVGDYADTLNSTSKINESEWNSVALQSSIVNETENMEKGLLESSKQTLPVGHTLIQVISGIQYVLGLLNSLWETMNIATHTVHVILEIIPPQFTIPDDIMALIFVAIILTFIGIVAYIFLSREWL